MTLLKDRPQRISDSLRGTVPRGRVVAFVLLVATCWAVLLATAPSPSGEPVLRTTSPGNAETVKSPDNVVLTFDRPVPAGLATVRIINPPGDQVVFQRPVHAGDRKDTISVPTPKKRYQGTYTVAWTLPSAGLEPLGGSFTFDVSDPIEPLGVPEIETTHDTTVSAIHTAMRFAALGAFVLLFGAVFFVAVIWPEGAHATSVRRLVKYSWFGLVLATAGVFASFGPYAAWAPLSGAFDPRLLAGTFESGAGHVLLTRLYVLIPATLGLAQLMTAPPPGSRAERLLRGATVLGCATAVAATWSLPSEPGPLAMAVDLGLLTGVSIAAGGLVTLLLQGGDTVPVRRFGLAAVVSAGLLVLTGGYLATRHVWLAAGLVAFVALLVVTFLILRRRRPEEGKRRRIDVRRFRRLAGVVTGLAGLILVATALLVVWQPPRTAHAQQPAALPASIREQAAPTRLTFDTGSLDLVLLPSTRDGQIRVDVHTTVLDRQGAAKDGTTVTAVLTRPDGTAAAVPVPLTNAAPGYSSGSATIPVRGRWELALTLRAPDGTSQPLTQPIDVS